MTRANTSFAHNIAIRYELKNETAAALNQSGFTDWFNPAAAIRVESKNLTGFIFSMIDIKFTRPVLSTVHIESKTHNQRV